VKISSEVRQGGNLSPYLFAIFVNNMLKKLPSCKLGCVIKCFNFNAIMYADDLLLMSLSVYELQLMVNICLHELAALGLEINSKKSVCV